MPPERNRPSLARISPVEAEVSMMSSTSCRIRSRMLSSQTVLVRGCPVGLPSLPRSGPGAWIPRAISASLASAMMKSPFWYWPERMRSSLASSRFFCRGLSLALAARRRPVEARDLEAMKHDPVSAALVAALARIGKGGFIRPLTAQHACAMFYGRRDRRDHCRQDSPAPHDRRVSGHARHPRGLKLELVDGEVVTMSPASAFHASIQSRLVRLIGNHLDATGSRFER